MKGRVYQEQMFQFSECHTDFWYPGKWYFGGGEMGEWCCYLTVVLDESGVKVGKPEEMLEVLS